MDIKNISSFLEKFKNLYTSREKTLKEIINTIQQITNITLEEKNIEFDKEIVFLKNTPSEKSVIFTKKEIILCELKKVLKEKAPQDIR